MKTLLITLAFFCSTATLFAKPVNQIDTSKPSTVKTLVCQVIEVKGENNQSYFLASFSDSTAVNNNFIVLASATIIEENKEVNNIEAYTATLKNKYKGIKIINTIDNKVTMH
jgi:hypothetical protein